ncbi:unnamed protein product [Adineta ricciae]|uniref:Tudor domain-containing protein n=1 Tax=Adineta ricciae TaxID=249248 RepID=A0A815KQ24_ADIRI|nr:unnamed protein product [Adineta ricciae]
MQRPIRGYRGGSRLTHVHRSKLDDEDDTDNTDIENRLCVSNSNSEDFENSQNENKSPMKSRSSSESSSITINTDFEAAIRSLRPLANHQQKNRAKASISNQKADLPQLNMNDDVTDNSSEPTNKKQSEYWFPKPDIGHIDSTDFIRHNHIETQQKGEQSHPPTLLTTKPPADISTRPTAIVASAAPTRSASALFTSTSSIMKATNYNTTDLRDDSSCKINQQPFIKSSLVQTNTSAFLPINPSQNSSSNTTNNSRQVKSSLSSAVSIDIPKHKQLERGQRLTRVRISHPQSPSVVHLMLHEDFKRACCLLHKMAAHSAFQSNSASVRESRYRPEVNQVCACLHEGRWFRCRVLQVSSDYSTITVLYVDWGMKISVENNSKYIRHLPNEFYSEPACSIMCHLDGVFEDDNVIPSDIATQCITLLSEDEYEIVVNDYHNITGGRIFLFMKGRNINEEIQRLLTGSKKVFMPEDILMEQFQYQMKLSVGSESKALLSSFSGNDDSFYVLLINENSIVIDRAMNELQEHHIPNREYLQIPQIKTLVVARYADDGRYYRAWVKSIDIENEQARVFFVDFGNESQVLFSDIYICPESVRTLPWLGIRVRLSNETMTIEELAKFWKLTESHYIWIRINEVHEDSYGVQIKIDYSVLLRHQRTKMSTTKRSVHKNIQTQIDGKLSYSRNTSDRNSCLLTPSITDQSQLTNENVFRNLIETINNELRSLRHRVNDSDEAAQDRHSQLMQFLFSIVNFNNNSNHQKQST